MTPEQERWFRAGIKAAANDVLRMIDGLPKHQNVTRLPWEARAVVEGAIDGLRVGILHYSQNIDRRALAPAAPEPAEVEPDMFWSKREGLYPEETPLEDWRDELDGADPFAPVEIEVGKRMGSRWVVYIPTEDSDHWHDDCHMFATEADARAALAAMGRV